MFQKIFFNTSLNVLIFREYLNILFNMVRILQSRKGGKKLMYIFKTHYQKREKVKKKVNNSIELIYQIFFFFVNYFLLKGIIIKGLYFIMHNIT